MITENELQNQHKRTVASQVFTTILANFSGIASGAAIGFSAIIIAPLTSNTNPYPLSYDQISWMASVVFITTMFGCFIGGTISDKWGRKIGIQFGNVICLIGWLLIITAYYIPPYQFFFLLSGRIISGISIGSSNVTSIVYTTETTDLKLRPMFTTWSGLSTALGILFIYFLGYFFWNNWGMISIITAILPLLSFISIVFFLPESPAWLHPETVVTESSDETIKEKKIIDSQSCSVDESTSLLLQQENVCWPKMDDLSLYKRLLQRTCLIPSVIITVYFFFLNFSGYFVIIAYAIDFVYLFRITLDPYLTICSFAIARLLGAIFVSVFSKDMGRRLLSIISGAVMTICAFFIGIYLLCIDKIPERNLHILSWIPIIAMWIYVVGCTIGFSTIPFAMAGEIFPLNIRGIASGISICLNGLFTFLAIKLYPTTLQIFGGSGLLIFYGVISLIGTIFVIFFLPETKGKTLRQIEYYFENCNSLLKFKVLK